MKPQVRKLFPSSAVAKPRRPPIDDAVRGFFAVEELAERWRISPSMVRKLIRLGELEIVRFGVAVRIPKRVALAYEARRG